MTFTLHRRLVTRPPRVPASPRAGRGPRARVALGVGGALFLALNFALATGVETVKPEWRDPEYGHRLKSVRARQAAHPQRPLVLVLGSSRVQMGVSPDAMGFPDQPGAPFVYNFGYRAGSPLVSWFLLARLLDDGVRPRAVLVVASLQETRLALPAEEQFRPWLFRLSRADLRRLAPYTTDPDTLAARVWAVRRNPLMAHRPALISDLAPDTQTGPELLEHRSWEKMDAHGFVRFPVESLSTSELDALVARAKAQAGETDGAPPGAISDRAVRDLVARCRAEGIAVAFAWAPEAPWLRAVYTSDARGRAAAYTRVLTHEVGVPVFPVPEHLEDADFVDGYHLTPAGAAKYSRWLADAHLRPWLAEAYE